MKSIKILVIIAFMLNSAVCLTSSPHQDCDFNKDSFPLGATFTGRSVLKITGGNFLETMEIKAIVDRDDAKAGRCFLKTELIIFYRNVIAFQMKWTINFNDMEALLGTSDSTDFKQYFHDFASLKGFYKLGSIKLNPESIDFNMDVVRDSIRSQGLSYDPAAVVRSLKKMKTIHGFIFNASWHEDRVLIAYCPEIKRFITIRRGIPVLKK